MFVENTRIRVALHVGVLIVILLVVFGINHMYELIGLYLAYITMVEFFTYMMKYQRDNRYFKLFLELF